MNQDEKRKLENELVVMGLSGLRSGELIQQLARLVNAWPGDRHEYVMALINSCEPERRTEMYEALRPHLTFGPLSLETYLCQMAERAGRMVASGRMRVEGEAPKPVEIGGQLYEKVSRQDSTNAMATLRCHKCNTVDRFIAETPVSAMLAARDAGWVRDMGLNKELCPDCQTVEVTPDA